MGLPRFSDMYCKRIASELEFEQHDNWVMIYDYSYISETYYHLDKFKLTNGITIKLLYDNDIIYTLRESKYRDEDIVKMKVLIREYKFKELLND